MADLIDRENLIDEIYSYEELDHNKTFRAIIGLIKLSPIVKAKEEIQKQAHWNIIHKYEDGFVECNCSNCGAYNEIGHGLENEKYCFNCDAEMVKQSKLNITCEQCYYGRDLGGNDYGCRSEKRRELNRQSPENRLVNKKDYSCKFAEGKYE